MDEYLYTPGPVAPDPIDRELIRLTQNGLPLCPEPYAQIAKQAGITPGETMARFEAMKERGVIRRIGVIPQHYALGYRYNGMSVWKVPEELIAELGPKVGAHPRVTHCYQRPAYPPHWPYNLFAMLHGRTREDVSEAVEEIALLLGSHDLGHEVLFSRKVLKKTGLRLKTDRQLKGGRSCSV